MELGDCLYTKKEIEGKFCGFLLNLTDQQIEWLRSVKTADWSEIAAGSAAQMSSAHARLEGVGFSVARRLIKAAIEQSGHPLPKGLNYLIAAAYANRCQKKPRENPQ